MVRFSNGFVAVINILTLLLSLSMIGYSLYLFLNHSSICQKFLQYPLFLLGISLLLISLLGLIGSCCHVQFFMWIYLTFMFLLILSMICCTLFVILVTNKGVGKAISGKGFKEYRLGDYSNWLQNNVVNEEHWDKIRSCLVDSNICGKLGGGEKETTEDFSKRNLSPIETGCCKPPTNCGFEFRNATFWVVPKDGPAVSDTDCKTWSNDQTTLCYDCESCKAGILANIKSQSRTLALVSTGFLVFAVIVYSVGCCALRNNKHRPYPHSKANA